MYVENKAKGAVERDYRPDLATTRPIMPFFVTIMRSPEPDEKCADKPMSDSDFVCIMTIDAGSAREACGRALLAYLWNKPSVPVTATADQR